MGCNVFSSPPHPDQFWGSPKSNQGMKLTSHLYLVLRLRMCGAISPLTQYIFMAWLLINGYILMAWYLIKDRDSFTFILIFVHKE
jgi:hypothetical protein